MRVADGRNTFMWITLLALLAVTAGCAGLRAVMPERPLLPLEEVPREVRDIYLSAEESYENRDYQQAMDQYGQIIDGVSHGPVVRWAHIRRGQLYILEGDYERSVRELRMVNAEGEDDPLYREARYYLARSYYFLGRYSLSKNIAETLLQGPLSEDHRIGLFTIMGDILRAEDSPYKAFLNYMSALREGPDKVMSDQIKSSIEDIVRHRLSREELIAAWNANKGGYPGGYILYTLAQASYTAGELVNAREYLDEYLDDYRRHPLYNDAQALKQRLVEMAAVDRYALGCILPLSGKYARFGTMALDAITLATEVFDPRRHSPLSIIVEDSRSDPEAAGEAVVRLFSRHRVVGIIGPMGSAAAVAAAREAEKLGIPIMTMTQRKGIASLGDYVFRHFMTAEMQMKALVRYAVENLGMIRFAILYPDDHYGTQMAHLFWDEVVAAGGEIRGVERYDTGKTDFSDEIKALTGLDYVDKGDKGEEPQPIVDFDALFIPDSYMRLSMIAPQLAFYNVTGVQLLGTNALNTSDRRDEDTEYMDGTIFLDSFFLNSYYPVARDFIDKFYVAYGREPTDLEALVFDAARIMVTALTDRRVEVRDDLQAALREMKDYQGVTGVTSFQNDGEADKSLSVLMIRNDTIVQVK
jgi:ABC-type branched-subunit amino acid transport system substrate-binding protein